MTYTITKKSEDGLSEQEKIIKEHLESWIMDAYKKAELNQRLQKAFENTKRHTKSLS